MIDVAVELTARRAAFVDRYIELGQVEPAAVKAGYSPRWARGNAHKLLKDERIKAAIAARMEQLASERIASAQEVLEYLSRVLRGEEAEEVVVMEGLGMGESRVKKVDKAIGAKDRIRAAELLGKRYALFVDHVTLTDERPNIIDDIGGESDG